MYNPIFTPKADLCITFIDRAIELTWVAVLEMTLEHTSWRKDFHSVIHIPMMLICRQKAAYTPKNELVGRIGDTLCSVL